MPALTADRDTARRDNLLRNFPVKGATRLFAGSLVCLEARTGKRVWHYQIVHHDIWDMDVTAAPVLVDITVNGKRIKAVAVVSKQAHTYVFNRVTGEPVWPIVERPVPQSEVPGEKTSPRNTNSSCSQYCDSTAPRSRRVVMSRRCASL